MQIIDRNTFREIVAQDGKYLHKVGSDTYIKRGILLPTESETDYEEVDTIPSEDELSKAKEAKIAEIAEYDKSSAVNEFSMRGKPMWLDRDTRDSLVNSIKAEQLHGKLNTVLWHDKDSYELPCDTALQMLSKLEIYAKECYNNTHSHMAAVDKLMSIAEVDSYDFKVGYPPKLVF